MPKNEDVILITGGTRGIGRAIALRFAERGAGHIALVYCMNHDAARTTAKEIRTRGVDCSVYPTDVSKPKLFEEVFDQVGERLGRLDIFVSNAARAAFRPVLDLNLRNWQRNMDLNARAFLQGAQLAAEIMKKNDGGKIVGLSSLGSSHAIPGYAGLGAAKAAIECLTRYLAAELAPFGINVNTVSGGFIDTESMRLSPDYEALKAYVAERAPGGRVGEPDDLAGIVTFLCSPAARWIYGQTVVADGGQSLVL